MQKIQKILHHEKKEFKIEKRRKNKTNGGESMRKIRKVDLLWAIKEPKKTPTTAS